MNSKTVVVGMSGGVDSSVCALLLKRQGYNVIGLFMKNWEEKNPDGVCRSTQDYEDVVKVCQQIDIPCYTVNFVKEYWDNVFSHFLEELKLGYTPNPDILCNREIKFKVFFEKAMSLGADYLATGHYCQIGRGSCKTALPGKIDDFKASYKWQQSCHAPFDAVDPKWVGQGEWVEMASKGRFCRANEFCNCLESKDSSFQLLKGSDSNKDQSYFLYTIQSKTLSKVLFPIGGMEKPQVRQIAKEHNLATSEKKDSTGICFIGKRDFKEFLGKYLAYQKGNFENLKGEVIGQHDGIAYYTIGQRKGLAIGGPGDAWFVVGKDVERNVVLIEQGTDHPALYAEELVATEASWVLGAPPQFPFACTAKVRYRQPDQECVIERIEAGKVYVRFLKPQRAITPRQAIVFYDGPICLGGATIQSTINTHS